MGGTEFKTQNFVLPAKEFCPMVRYRYPRAEESKFEVSELSIVHSALGTTSFQNFLSCFKAVKSLEYNFDYDMIQPNQEYRETHVDFSPSELRNAISHLSESLKELSITQENHRDPQHPILDPGIMSLSEFQNLKKLIMSAIVLVGTNMVVRHLDTPYTEDQIRNFVSVFPSSLEQLTIKHCDNAIVEPVMAFLQGELPQDLTSIDLEFSDDAAIKPQFLKGQFLVETALKKGGGAYYSCLAN
jgi:hypothetical protein